MQNIEPDVIRNYLIVAETGSLTLTAKRVGKGISAISYQMAGLEAAVGQKLFMRHKYGMNLSKDGHQLLHRAKFLLEIHDSIFNTKSCQSRMTKAPIRKRKKTKK